jgi:lysophospholipase L1-like esterase
LKIWCPNYSGSEAAPGATTAITASVEYPPGVFQQIKFSTSSSGTIPNGGALVSDYLTLTNTIVNGDKFWIRCHLVNSAGCTINVETSGAYCDLGFMGDRYEASGTDLTMSGDISFTLQNESYHPTVIAPITAPSVLILGDSVVLGVTDTVDPNSVVDPSGDRGAVARTTGPKFGYANCGFPGETATTFVSSHTQRLSLLPYCTHVIINYGTNDVFAGDSKATIEGHLTTIYGLCTGKTVFQTTIVPRTTSTDSWATATNQTVLSQESVRTTLNDDFRAGTFKPAGGIFNICSPVETSLNSGKWTFPTKTDDGIHPNHNGCIDIKTAGVIDTTLIGTATPIVDSGSVWADKGTFVTLGTIKRTNDAATSAGGSYSTVRGATGLGSGLKYFEIEFFGPMVSGWDAGLMTNATATGSGLDFFVGNITDSFGIASDGSPFNFVSGTIFTVVGSAGALTLDPIQHGGVVWGFAVDFTNKFAYLRANNTWFLSANPASGATGTGHCATWTGTPTLYPGFSFFTSSINPVRLRTNVFLYALPSGYSAWG